VSHLKDELLLVVSDGRIRNYISVVDALTRLYGRIVILGGGSSEEKAVRIALISRERLGLKLLSMRYGEKGRSIYITLGRSGGLVDEALVE
jgi:hypothetical protein